MKKKTNYGRKNATALKKNYDKKSNNNNNKKKTRNTHSKQMRCKYLLIEKREYQMNAIGSSLCEIYFHKAFASLLFLGGSVSYE